jgi:predicted nucleic acid-binding Zn ribbon protein
VFAATMSPMSSTSRTETAISDTRTDEATYLAMRSCLVCGWPISVKAAMCPQCGHPINPHKSSATMVLIFGILSLFLPMYGVVFGGLAWGFGNREIREIDAGLRAASGRTQARVGRVLGVIGTALWGGMLVLFVIGMAFSGF